MNKYKKSILVISLIILFGITSILYILALQNYPLLLNSARLTMMLSVVFILFTLIYPENE